MQELNNSELKILKILNTPAKIQDFLDKIPINFEDDGKGETCMSPLSVLRNKKAHCIEAAFLAALAIRINNIGNGKALVVDMRATKNDFDHVIAVFQDNKSKKWGAISKSNHAVLRYREPVYRDIRELVMSYFHEYTDDNGKKTLREYSEPLDLSVFDDTDWITTKDNLWFMHDYLDSVKHHAILEKGQHRKLRLADGMERMIGKITEWKKQ